MNVDGFGWLVYTVIFPFQLFLFLNRKSDGNEQRTKCSNFSDVDFSVVSEICDKVKTGHAENRLQNINTAANYIFQVFLNLYFN